MYQLPSGTAAHDLDYPQGETFVQITVFHSQSDHNAAHEHYQCIFEVQTASLIGALVCGKKK